MPEPACAVSPEPEAGQSHKKLPKPGLLDVEVVPGSGSEVLAGDGEEGGGCAGLAGGGHETMCSFCWPGLGWG